MSSSLRSGRSAQLSEALTMYLFGGAQGRASALALLGLTALCALSASALLLYRAWSSAPPPPSWAPLYVERFDDPTLLQRARRSAPDQGYEPNEAAWRIEGGRLWGEGGHNAALWLPDLQLPDEARLELKARAETETGDLKCELYGDGLTHQSGMILINGGWSNRLRVIARRDEHGEDRRSDRRCAPRCAPQGVEQSWVIERRSGVISWYIDGQLSLRWKERAPLSGRGFALNHWEAKVSYDDLVVYDLKPPR